MPVKKDEAYRALELLEEYYSRLNRPQDKQLRGAIERVIQIFKSRLFQALIDIQEFYEETLLDDQKTLGQKTVETNQVATKWERPAPTANSVILPPAAAYVPPEEPLPPPPSETANINALYAVPNKVISAIPAQQQAASTDDEERHPPPLAPKPHTAPKPSTAPKPKITKKAEPKMEAVEPPPVPPKQMIVGEGDDWEYEEIVLERGSMGLGISIAGGTDSPHIGTDPSIYITKVIEGGTAAADGRLRVNDVILSVNGASCVNITHAESVDALKKAGKTVTLYVRRRQLITENDIEIDLVKGAKGLGFSIAGGIGNQHIAGDNGIFITKVIDGGAAQMDGRLQTGDRLIMVNDVSLENVDHEFAVATLKATKQQVRLLIGRPVDSGVPAGTVSVPTTAVTNDKPVVTAEPVSAAVAAKSHKTKKKKPAVVAAESAAAAGTTPASGRRKLVLRKGPTGLGFNIVGGEDGEGIFVSFILPGGQADLSGELHKGDQLISVNGTDLQDATHEQAAAVLKGAGEVVEIVALYKPDEFAQFEAKIRDLREQMMNTSAGSLKSNQKRTVYVRALFDYDPAKDSDLPGQGITFRFGDILQVTTGGGDEEWWQAQSILPRDDAVGFIPSKQRVEKKERARLRAIKLQAKEKSKKKKKGKADEEDEKVLSYEVVEQQNLQFTRPVIILGPLKDRFNDDLVADFPRKFASCVPHTTRARRENEVDGRDYHFVASREEMERDIENHLFVEAGQFNNNLYGTSIQSVKEVALQGRHCILDVSGNAIKRLHTANIYPVAVFVKPPSVEAMVEWSENLSEDQAYKAYEKTLKIEEEFGELFSAVVSGTSADDIYEQVKQVIDEQSGPTVWIANNQPL